jgi:hypothetical protein
LARRRGRYAFQLDKALRLRIAELEGCDRNMSKPSTGRATRCHRAVLAFTGPDRAYVYGEPGFEAGWQAAKISGAPAIAVSTDAVDRARYPGHVCRDGDAGAALHLQSQQPDRHDHAA